jgi:methylglutamate dehydrogenase subunit D
VADFLAHLPLGHILPPGAYGAAGAAGVRLRRQTRQAATLVAGRDRAALNAAVAKAFGVALIDAPQVSTGDDIAFVGIGPGRWLVLSQNAGLRLRLERAVGASGSAFEQSGGLVVLEAGGPALPDVLAKLVALDLDPGVFPIGAAATTNVAHINVTFWKTAPGEVSFALGSSFVSAFLRVIAAAAAEYGFLLTHFPQPIFEGDRCSAHA